MKTTEIVLAAMEVFRDKLGEGSSDLSVSNVLALLVIARNPETPVVRVQEALGLSQPAVSRNISKLGNGRPDKPGMHLIEQYEDPYDRRSKIARLTPQGREVIKALDTRLAKFFTKDAK